MSKVLMKIDNELFTGSALVDTGEEPTLTWKGARISGLTWGRIAGFLAAVYEKHKTEAQLRLLYNTKHRKWAVFVHGQEVSGASVVETLGATSDPEYKTLHDAGFEQFGTVHSHATMGAFQSGTDHADEASAPGLHITVGKLGSDMFDFHSRLVYKGQQYEISLSDWVAWEECLPGGTDTSYIEKIPDALRDPYVDALRRYALSRTGEFPKPWMAKVKLRSVMFNRRDSGYESLWPSKRKDILTTALPISTAQADTYFEQDDDPVETGMMMPEEPLTDDEMVECLLARYGDSTLGIASGDETQEVIELLWTKAQNGTFFDNLWYRSSGGHLPDSTPTETLKTIKRIIEMFHEDILLEMLQDIADAIDSPDSFRQVMEDA